MNVLYGILAILLVGPALIVALHVIAAIGNVLEELVWIPHDLWERRKPRRASRSTQ